MSASASELPERVSVSRNIAATFASSAWTSLIGLAFVPVYIAYLGIEAYGLIGVYYTLLALTSLVDFGITATVTRESAGLVRSADGIRRARDLVRTLEIVYWGIGVGLALIALALVPVLAAHWLQPVGLGREALRQTLLLIAIAIWVQWPQSFYSGALLGLQKHVLLGGVNAALMTVRALGAVLVLAFVSSTMQAFFAWQIAISALGTLLGWALVWRSLPADDGRHPSFRQDRLREVWRFAAGVGTVAVLGVLLTQIDKILLSRLLRLDVFGYYALAGVAAAMLLRVAQPIYDGVFPRLTQLVAAGVTAEVTRFYHASCQLLSVAILPAALVLSAFSLEVLHVWTGDSTIVAETYRILAVLAAGTGLHALLFVPWALQLANRWTTLGLLQNAAAVLVLPWLVWLLARSYGGVGAAFAWLVLNIFYLLVGQTLMHRRLLRGQLLRWYTRDVALPLLGAVAIVAPARLLLPGGLGRAATALALAAIGVAALTAAALAAPELRTRLLRAAGAGAAGSRLTRRWRPLSQVDG